MDKVREKMKDYEDFKGKGWYVNPDDDGSYSKACVGSIETSIDVFKKKYDLIENNNMGYELIKV